MVLVGPLAGLFWSVDALNAQCHRAGTIDDSGQQESRAKPTALGNGVTNRGYEFKFVAAIAHRGHSSRQINRAPLDLFEVSVHVPEAGQKKFAFSIDHVGVFRDLY